MGTICRDSAEQVPTGSLDRHRIEDLVNDPISQRLDSNLQEGRPSQLPLTIVLLEYNVLSRIPPRVVSGCFEVRGSNVLMATDPRLLTSMDITKFRVILLDIDMPRLLGLDVLKLIRKQNVHVTTIMVSGRSDLTTRLSSLDKGADFFMAKPIDLAELYLVVQRIVGHEEGAIHNDPEAYWQLSRSRLTLIAPDGDEVGLSASE